MPSRWRNRASVVLACLCGLLLALAGLSAYARGQLVDEEAFSARAASALDDEAFRSVLAQRTTDGLVDATSDDLLAIRPLLNTAVEALVRSDPFREIFELAVEDVHGVLFSGRSSLILDLDRGTVLLLDALRSVSPYVARQIPENVRPQLTQLSPEGAELTGARRLEDLSRWAWPLTGATLLAGLGALMLAPHPRRGLARLGAGVAASGAAVAALVWGAGILVANQAATAADLDDERERDAVAALWSALFGDLQTAALLTAFAGTALAAVATGALAPAQLRAIWGWITGAARAGSRGAQLGRGVLLIGLGAALLAEPAAVLQVLVVLGGIVLVFLGVAEIATGLERRAVQQAEQRGRRGGPIVAAGAATASALIAVAAIALIAVAIPGPQPERVADKRPAAGCNGAPELCDRRLSDVAFAATHNSFSAADQPNWLFANQEYPIAEQLEDGVRGLFLDIHYGVRDPASGRVRTDLATEDRSRNRVARELSPAALETADRLVGRAGLGQVAGPPQPYLCHTLCELGAESLDSQLAVIRRFVDENPSEVLVLYIEPYVEVGDFERALDRQRLLPRLARLDRDKPLPTLGELVRAKTPIVVLTERDGGTRPWYLAAFSFAQDTPLGATKASQFSCERNRGDRDSPLLLVNHWIDTFPPSPSRNRRVGGKALEQRLARCERERRMMPNLVAVDFYERAGVVEAVRALNARG